MYKYVICCVLLPPALLGQEIIVNPTGRAYQDELVHFKAPAPVGPFSVHQNEAEIPFQVEKTAETNRIWICTNFDPNTSRTFRIVPGKSKAVPSRVHAHRVGEYYVLENEKIGVRFPAEGKGGPIAGVKHGDKWVGGSFWKTSLPLKKYTVQVLAEGPLWAKVRLHYDFDGQAGLDGEVPACAEMDITLGPGWNHVEISERHEMSRGDYWEFEASRGWSPRRGVSKPFSGGAGSGKVVGKVEPERALKPGGLPFTREDLFINLLPRWNQHYRDGWCFAATDGTSAVGAVAVHAGRWVWPHNNGIEVVVKPSGDYAGLRCPTWKGKRQWWLFAPSLAPADIGYVTRYAWENLDKLNHEFSLATAGLAIPKKPGGWGMNYYSGQQMNPTSMLRGVGRQALSKAGTPGDFANLMRTQMMFHPDAYGSLWNHWSPENANFFTDFYRVPIALTTGLKQHPRFEELRKMAEERFKEDMYHSVTLPGGAGQECPGYLAYALKQWSELAPVCRQPLGFDPTTWERFRAAQYFLQRTSQPDGKVRRMLPMGDTHPDKTGDGPKIVDVPAAEIARFKTEELPGFGAIFTNQPGTEKETYLAFKSGPNRGHYHGDQLAFHYCARARPVAVDHHCSYNPRAGQEHMHNRVAFNPAPASSPKGVDWQYTNMDGFERLLACKTSPSVDIAVGQVESERLRQVEKLPPEIWHQEYPQHAFAKPLVYRRTVVFIKGGQEDYFVLRDQYWAPETLSANFCLHVRSGKMESRGPVVDFGNLTLYCVAPAKFKGTPFPWSHSNGGTEATQGIRLGIEGPTGEFITVMYPGRLPAISPLPGGVKVAEDEIVFAGNQPTAGDPATQVTVTRAGKVLLTLSGNEINLDRSQGEIGLFVPDAGYPMGEIPDWLVRQRGKRPAWAR